jgi:hypothetical protein
MNEKELNSLFNSSLVYDHLIKSKCAVTAHLEDGVKFSGRLLGWDRDYLIILSGKTLQMFPASKLARIEAELNDVAAETPAMPELPKPKFTPEPVAGNEIKDQIMASKPQTTDNTAVPAKDRLDHLVKNW